MRKIGMLFCLWLGLLDPPLFAQQKAMIDSLQKILPRLKEDTSKVRTLNLLALELRNSNLQEAFQYAKKGQNLATQLRDEKGLASAYRVLGILYQNQAEYQKSLENYEQALKISRKISYQVGIATALGGKGLVLKDLGNYRQAIEALSEAIQIFEQIGDKRSVALNYNSVGLVYYNQGEYDQALVYYFKALRTNEADNNKLLMAINYNSIGLVYEKQKSFDKAIEFYQKAIQLNTLLNNQIALASNYNNIGIIYDNQYKYEQAIKAYQKAYEINTQLKRQASVGINLTNMANIYKKQGKYDQALENYLQALPTQEASGKKLNIAMVQSDIADIYRKKRLYTQAVEYAEKSLQISLQIRAKDMIKENYELLSIIYADMKEYEKALKSKELAIAYKDSIYNEKTSKQIASLQANYELEKKQNENALLLKDIELQRLANAEKNLLLKNKEKELALEKEQRLAEQQQAEIIEEKRLLERKQNEIALLNKEKELEALNFKQRQQEEKANYDLRVQRIITYALAFAILPLALWLFSLYTNSQRRKKTYKILKQQNDEIIQKNLQINQKNSDLLESINYALRIQRAILPLTEELNHIFEHYAILYKPRDIVSGDFYWCQNLNQQESIFALADCTGHGVPGAFMSMIGNQLLYDIIVRDAIYEVNIILDKLHTEILRVLKQDETHNSDGMDIVLLHIHHANYQVTFTAAKMNSYISIEPQNLQAWTQANRQTLSHPKLIDHTNPDTPNNKFYEIKGDQMPIGGVDLKKRTPYEALNFQFAPQNIPIIYLYTDGYPDQFGGSPYKKFLKSNFREMLRQIATQNIAQQKIVLEQTLNQWMEAGKAPQTDDILVAILQPSFEK